MPDPSLLYGWKECVGKQGPGYPSRVSHSAAGMLVVPMAFRGELQVE